MFVLGIAVAGIMAAVIAVLLGVAKLVGGGR